jgi:hypothetical protein
MRKDGVLLLSETKSTEAIIEDISKELVASALNRRIVLHKCCWTHDLHKIKHLICLELSAKITAREL